MFWVGVATTLAVQAGIIGALAILNVAMTSKGYECIKCSYATPNAKLGTPGPLGPAWRNWAMFRWHLMTSH